MSSSAILVPRRIVEIHRESPRAVIVALDCGHRRHVRHRPPLHVSPWVLDDSAVGARTGSVIECLRCGQRELPEDMVVYKRTRDFDEASTPAGLRGTHRTKDGVWGRLVVEQGRLWVSFEPPLSVEVQAGPDAPVLIPCALPHHVRLAGEVRFHVEFLRREGAPG